jgi:hypothetical protein
MATSNEGNEGNEGNVGSLGRAGGAGFGLLPDRVDLPFITEGRVAQQRLDVRPWNDGFWSGDWSAWRMLIDFAQAAELPYARPPLRVVTLAGSVGGGVGTCVLDAATPALPAACVGVYAVRCVVAPTTAKPGVMRLAAPSGRVVVDQSFPTGPTTAISFSEELKFVVTQGAADFRRGEGFDIKVTAMNVTVQSAGNTGNGTCVPDLTIPLLGTVQAGTYQVRCTIAPNTFVLKDPLGNVVQTAVMAANVAQFNTQLKFEVQQGSTAFALNDGFNLVVGRLLWLDEPEKLRTGRKLAASVAFTPAAAGKGSCVMDPISPTRSDTQVGAYTLTCTNAAGDGTFALKDPSGTSLGNFALAAGAVVVAREVYLTIRKGLTPFVVGDTFTITVELQATTFPERELKALIRLAEDERPDALGEIVAQMDGFIGYFMAALGISPKTHPNTCQLLYIGSLIGAYGSMHFKGLYQRRRPAQLAPGLMPPIPVPGHPAYPSGHSTQAHLMALCVKHALPTGNVRSSLGEVIDELADRIARNREIAGVHFESDSKGGENLAQSLFDILSSTALPTTLPQSIPPAANNPTTRRFQSISAAAQGEWP